MLYTFDVHRAMDTIGLYLMATCVFSLTNAQVSDGCKNPLGMKSGRILDRQLTSSSAYTDSLPNVYDETEGRLDGGSCWIANNLNNQWIQVDFNTPMYVSGIVLQGGPYYWNPAWVTAYKVHYGIDDSSNWQNVKDENHDDMVFRGNSDRNSHVTNLFTSEVRVTRIRIRPTEWHEYVSMRFEILGCEDINECDRNPCMNGECQESPNQYTCICDAGWTGYNCDQDINECAGSPCVNGQCEDGINQYACVCHEGWSGNTCNENINECANSPCVNGQCEDGINQYTCVCDAGWNGTNCDENINECDRNPCMNGQCQDGINQYRCVCDAGWTGYNCYQESAAATTRASVVTSIATSSESVTKELSETTPTTIVALASKALAMSSGSASTAVGASIGSIVLLLIMGGVIVLVVMKRRRRQQHPESNKSQTVVQLDGPYGDTVTNIITSPPTKDSHIYAGVTGANGDAVATPPTDELYQDVSDKSSEVHQGTDETYQDITEETKGNTSAHDDDIYQDVQDNEYAYAHVDTVRDKVPRVDGNLVQIDAKSQYGGAPRSADNRNQQEGWVDNDIYAMSDEDQQPKRQTGDDNRAEGWVENDIYATSDEDHLKRQGEENDKEEGWMDNSIYATTDE